MHLYDAFPNLFELSCVVLMARTKRVEFPLG